MSGNQNFNLAKTDFSSLYEAPNPRPYFLEMARVHYRIPENALPWFLRTIEMLKVARQKDSITVLDIGCSYGVNGILLKYRTTLDDVYHQFLDAQSGLSKTEAGASDREYFASLQTRKNIRVLGVDKSKPAVDYAKSFGLIDDGVAIDLEVEELHRSSDFLDLGELDLIVSTGCIGYVTVSTFEKVLSLAARQGSHPWVASSVLRTFDYGQFDRHFQERGLTSRRAPRPLLQRKIVSDIEQEQTIRSVRSLGRHPEGLEATGRLYADFFLAVSDEELSPETDISTHTESATGEDEWHEREA